MIEGLKAPPHAEGPEKSILSSMLQDPVEFIPRAFEAGLTPEKFYKPNHQKFFRLLSKKYQKGETIELVQLTQDLIDREELDSMGGPSSVTEFYTYAPSSAHFSSHLTTVLEKHQLRASIRFGTKIIELANSGESMAEILPQIELGALTLGTEAEEKSGYDYSVKCAYQELLELLQSDEGEGIPTGFSNIDAVTGGLRPGEVTVVAARSGIGKTAFAISLVENLSLHAGVSTALFAVEGKRTYLTTRLMAMAAHISAKRIRDKQITKGDLAKISKKMNDTKDAPLRLDDRISNAVEIAAKIRRMQQQSPLQVVIIDYIQKLPASSSDERRDVRMKIKNATDILHQTCKPLNIALVLLAQLKRESDKENPKIEELMESASMEQDGDTVILLGDRPNQPEDLNTPREKLIRIAKNRHGPCSDLTLNFNPPTTRFS